MAFPASRLFVALTIAMAMATRGLKKRSLSKSGAGAAFVVGLLSFMASYRMGITLILFYQSSSSLTKVGNAVKKKLEADHKEGGQRGVDQVLACSLLATIIAVVYMASEGLDDAPIHFEVAPRRSFLLCAYLSHYACCNGDTWASELGVLDPWVPRLVTQPWRSVPKGTNGGMSATGTAASLAAGLFIGAGFWLMSPRVVPDGTPSQLPLVWLGGAMGFGGSLLDSLLGATLQATNYDEEKKMIASDKLHNSNAKGITRVCGMEVLSNEAVNAISVAVTTAAGGFAGAWLMP